MKSWPKAVGFGVLVWLVPFVVAVLVFPLHKSSRPLFESIMAVTVTATAVVFALRYMKQVAGNFVRESIRLGLLWFAMAIAIDAPLMLLGGPMKMSLGHYMADIGVTYLCIPAVCWAIGVARSWPPNADR